MSDDRTTPVPVWDVLYALRVFVTGECVIERSGPVLLTIEIIQGATFGETLRRLRKIVLSHRPRVDPLADREGCYSATTRAITILFRSISESASNDVKHGKLGGKGEGIGTGKKSRTQTEKLRTGTSRRGTKEAKTKMLRSCFRCH